MQRIHRTAGGVKPNDWVAWASPFSSGGMKKLSFFHGSMVLMSPIYMGEILPIISKTPFQFVQNAGIRALLELQVWNQRERERENPMYPVARAAWPGVRAQMDQLTSIVFFGWRETFTLILLQLLCACDSSDCRSLCWGINSLALSPWPSAVTLGRRCTLDMWPSYHRDKQTTIYSHMRCDRRDS